MVHEWEATNKVNVDIPDSHPANDPGHKQSLPREREDVGAGRINVPIIDGSEECCTDGGRIPPDWTENLKIDPGSSDGSFSVDPGSMKCGPGSLQKEVRVTSETGGQKGVKDARLDLIPATFLWGLSLVFGMGAKKYDVDNYLKGYSWRLSYGACQRHLNQFWMGENIDKESGLHHLLHAAWHACALFVFSTNSKYKQFDDRLNLENPNDPKKQS